MAIELISKQKQCGCCGSAFGCGSGGEGACWCYDLPPLFAPDPSLSCLCPTCLKKETVRKIDEYVSSLQPGDVLRNKAKELPKTKPLEEIDFYVENGLYVFTAWYLLKRGYCCGNGCRHCPYQAKQ